MLKFFSLSSGSSGNCYYICEPGKSAVLIDAGVSYKRICKVLRQEMHVEPESIGAILVTHDHLDHIRSLDGVCKHLPRPVYIAKPLHGALAAKNYIQTYTSSNFHAMPEDTFVEVVPGFEVRWFEVPHDATHTSGFVIKADGHLIVHITDCGKMTPEALEWARQADTLTIESNYDPDMLEKCHYTAVLQSRIRGGHGHMSNGECAEALKAVYHPGLKNIFLCHISQNSNTPALALESAREALRSIGVDLGTVNLRTLKRGDYSPCVNL